MVNCPVTVEPDAERLRPADIPVLSGDASRLERATGWRPEIPLEQTLADTLEAARQAVVAGV
jgi:GDP-4-dehydro-6-deoxy-D-mannose reductase